MPPAARAAAARFGRAALSSSRSVAEKQRRAILDASGDLGAALGVGGFGRELEAVMRRVLTSRLVSRETRELLLSVLMHDPFLRPSAAEIKRKACFAIVDFPALLRGELPPPRVPTVRGPLDVSNFDDYEMDDKYLKGGPYRGSPTDWDYSF